jgi:hypothetical protein
MTTDPVSPEDAAYVIRRDGGCVVGVLILDGTLPELPGCSSIYGRPISTFDTRGLTIAHVRDRGKGGRLGKRPPSRTRHLVACCYGHHLAHPYVDRAEVRDALDDYLEELEGADPEERPHEVIARVRSARSILPAGEGERVPVRSPSPLQSDGEEGRRADGTG